MIQLVEQAKADGRTVIFSSHVLSEVEEVCDRVAILRAGKVALTQTMGDLHRRHRIHLELESPLPPPPESLKHELSIHENRDGTATIETNGALPSLLNWIATIRLQEVRIEPAGLKAIYEQVHPPVQDPETVPVSQSLRPVVDSQHRDSA